MGRPVHVDFTNQSDIKERIEAGYKLHAFNQYVRKAASYYSQNKTLVYRDKKDETKTHFFNFL
jgi:hypothetical protein